MERQEGTRWSSHRHSFKVPLFEQPRHSFEDRTMFHRVLVDVGNANVVTFHFRSCSVFVDGGVVVVVVLLFSSYLMLLSIALSIIVVCVVHGSCVCCMCCCGCCYCCCSHRFCCYNSCVLVLGLSLVLWLLSCCCY